ncbi:hypothetical protein PanWU01x14_178080, partial [Parasponia andersonii]
YPKEACPRYQCHNEIFVFDDDGWYYDGRQSNERWHDDASFILSSFTKQRTSMTVGSSTMSGGAMMYASILTDTVVNV